MKSLAGVNYSTHSPWQFSFITEVEVDAGTVVAGSDFALVLAGFAQPASVEWPAEWDPATEKIALECCLFVHWRKQPSAAAVAEGPTQLIAAPS